jgi:hypothetical protein
MSTTAQPAAGLRSAPSVAFAVVLFTAWSIETILWVYATIHSLADGEVTPLITALATLALFVLLAGMEGLEVSVIDRSRVLFKDRGTPDLAAWLAARQLFVALIVTTATLLAHRDAIIIPGSGTEITKGIVLGLFDLTWTGFAVLWFAQILPKHMAATNPDRYLRHTRNSLFPIVRVVQKAGVSLPAEAAATVVERRLDWYVPEGSAIEEAPATPAPSPAAIWRELIPSSAPASRSDEVSPTGRSGRRG